MTKAQEHEHLRLVQPASDRTGGPRAPRTTQNIPAMFEPAGSGADDRRSIDATDIDLEDLSAQAWDALERTNTPPRLFRFGNTPVRVDPADDGATPVPKQLTPNILSHELARAAHWHRFTNKLAIQSVAPPTRVIQDMLAAPSYPLPPLRGIVGTPVFAPDGSLQTDPGYHANGQTYFAPDPGFLVPAVPEHPTAKDVSRATTLILDDLMGDFPFVNHEERANAMALMLDPYVRNLIVGPTPLRMIEAPTPGSGKGVLAEVILRTAIGDRFELTPAPDNNDEWRKSITTKLAQAPAVIVIDNLTSVLDSGALAAALTATSWSSRRLGTNDDISVPARSLWVMTANNPSTSTEIARRTVRIRLDSDMERPWTRTEFRHEDLRSWARAHRAELVWAALTIVRAWVAAGQPRGRERLGSYEDWAAVQGGILANAGIGGFLANAGLYFEAADVEGEKWRQLLNLWWEQFGGREVGVAEIFPVAQAVEGLDLGTGSEHSQRVRLGRQLGHYRDRVFGDLRIVQARTLQRAQRWQLISTKSDG